MITTVLSHFLRSNKRGGGRRKQQQHRSRCFQTSHRIVTREDEREVRILNILFLIRPISESPRSLSQQIGKKEGHNVSSQASATLCILFTSWDRLAQWKQVRGEKEKWNERGKKKGGKMSNRAGRSRNRGITEDRFPVWSSRPAAVNGHILLSCHCSVMATSWPPWQWLERWVMDRTRQKSPFSQTSSRGTPITNANRWKIQLRESVLSDQYQII